METNKYLKEFEKKYNYEVIGAEQGSEAWFTAKLGVISASNADKVLAGKTTKTRATYMHTLCAQVLTGLHHDVAAKSMEWGSDSEDAARASYEVMNDCKLTELPFVFKDSSFRCGASPDSLTDDGGGVEIKCPFNSANHMAFIDSGYIKPEWNYQLQFTMWVMGVDSWDFCSFDPRFKVKPLAIKTVARDEGTHKKFDDLVPLFTYDMDKMLKELGVEFGDQWKGLGQ